MMGELEFPETGKATSQDAGGNKKFVSIHFGAIKLMTDPPIEIETDLLEMPLFKASFDGLLGRSWLGDYELKIDFTKGDISLEKK